MTNNPIISELKLKTGERLRNAEIETRAERVAGFMGIVSGTVNGDNDYKPATRYINISEIAEMTIDNETLAKWAMCMIVPEQKIKVKVDN